ncbi:malonyl-ACP O-methyltransferase BioC [Photobacterium galatheae]|uniref:Malonyl-[acyl-carrier protein] O-methyltransferase n=1 Tax=Photobacterium galatheae TaxID=1654360 RepID=A0A066RPC1_9GAMM|nr:malonyl-ACP O-methyltransferase BioC [Photobacterium galatheae]KDM92315.1 biotin synthase [Photobacterium galatheae]MCM0150504.1 malonyl-ACP O-methyltransferase BioC [Photobacterium galatheae]
MQQIRQNSRTDCLNRVNPSAEKQAIAASFGKAAKQYDASAAFQRRVGHRLLEQLPVLAHTSHWLDVGCGTGYFTRQLQGQHYQTTAVDLSFQMLEQAQARCQGQGDFQHADAEALPFADNTFDAAFSSLALQWCRDLRVPLKELKRVVKPGGVIGFTTLAEGSLFELQQSWQAVDQALHVNQYAGESALVQAVESAGFTDYQLVVEPVVMHYESAFALMKDLKGIGATHLSQHRRQGLFGRTALNLIEQAYASFRDHTGQLPATYQVCFGVLNND